MPTINLRNMAINQTGTIVSVRVGGELGRRIREMGLVPGTEITIKQRAPLNDPVALRVMDGTLTLRNNEADYIEVVVTPCPPPDRPPIRPARTGRCRPGNGRHLSVVPVFLQKIRKFPSVRLGKVVDSDNSLVYLTIHCRRPQTIGAGSVRQPEANPALGRQ